MKNRFIDESTEIWILNERRKNDMCKQRELAETELLRCPSCDKEFPAEAAKFCPYDGAKLVVKKDFSARLAELERKLFGQNPKRNPLQNRKAKLQRQQFRVNAEIRKLKTAKGLRYADALKQYCEANPADGHFCR